MLDFSYFVFFYAIVSIGSLNQIGWLNFLETILEISKESCKLPFKVSKEIQLEPSPCPSETWWLVLRAYWQSANIWIFVSAAEWWHWRGVATLLVSLGQYSDILSYWVVLMCGSNGSSQGLEKRSKTLFQISLLLFSTWREYFYSHSTNFYSQPNK